MLDRGNSTHNHQWIEDISLVTDTHQFFSCPCGVSYQKPRTIPNPFASTVTLYKPEQIMVAQFMTFAQLQSSCSRGQVACALASLDYKFTAVAWNGSPEHHGCDRPDEMGNCGCVHAEVRAASRPRMFEPHWAFVSRAPCERCAKVLVDIGVKRVFYFEDSRPMREGFLVFDRAGVVYAKAKLGGATA